MRALPVLDAPKANRADPRSVRLSLTDRCDLACVYCRPDKRDGYFEETLDLAAFTALLRGLYAGGVRRVRITGGEPLLSPLVVDAVRAIRDVGFVDVALTTNATRLSKLAAPLLEAGLQRINVSLDTLEEARFERITRGGKLAAVLSGIDAMVALPFTEKKLNVVVVRGENDDELESLARFAWARGITPRFLEVMAIGEGANLSHKVVPYAEQRARLAHLLEDDRPERDLDRGPARYVRARAAFGPHRVGFITGTTDTYCDGCDRLRVAADGTLRPCLAKNDGVSAADEATRGDVEAVRRRLTEAWQKKPDGETFRGCTEPSAREVSIRKIGG
ncbi:MAG: radical SAM protein [Polyangiaceae bacterium]